MASDSQREAIKLIAEWSKWLIGVQTLSIGFVASLLKPNGKPTTISAWISHKAEISFGVGLICFVLSIIAAGALQASLPLASTDLADHENLWDRNIYFLNRSFGKIWAVSELQFGLFLVSSIALTISVWLLMQ